MTALVRESAAREAAHGRQLLVYVGATWCEPCQRFHGEVQSGALNARLPDVTFLEFDSDRDKSRLTAAGYTSTYVPLVAKPDKDGRASAQRVSGVIKGHDPADDLVGKIREMLPAR